MVGVADDAAVGVGAEVQVRIAPIWRARRWWNPVLVYQRWSAEQHDRRGEAVGVTARHGRISHGVPDLPERKLWEVDGHLSLPFRVGGCNLPEIVAAAATPYNHRAESLRRQRVKHRSDQRVMQLARQIQVTRTKALVLGRWSDGDYGEDNALDAVVDTGSLGRRQRDCLGEPAVEVDREMGALLLCAAHRHDCYSPIVSEPGDLLVSQASVAHGIRMSERTRPLRPRCRELGGVLRDICRLG